MGEQKTCQRHGLHILCEAEIHSYNSKNMEKMNFHNKEKAWENTKIPTKLRVSYIFHMKQKSIKFPNHGMSGVPYFKANVGKHNGKPYHLSSLWVFGKI